MAEANQEIAPSSDDASARLSRVRQKDTAPETRIRKELYARGLRYRVQYTVLSKPRRVADIAFIGPNVAVFVDGCFWHGCPEHATWPKRNADFWRNKILTNQARDRDTNERLRAAGWEVVRIWAHERTEDAADRIQDVVRSRKEVRCE